MISFWRITKVEMESTRNALVWDNELVGWNLNLGCNRWPGEICLAVDHVTVKTNQSKQRENTYAHIWPHDKSWKVYKVKVGLCSCLICKMMRWCIDDKIFYQERPQLAWFTDQAFFKKVSTAGLKPNLSVSRSGYYQAPKCKIYIFMVFRDLPWEVVCI